MKEKRSSVLFNSVPVLYFHNLRCMFSYFHHKKVVIVQSNFVPNQQEFIKKQFLTGLSLL